MKRASQAEVELKRQVDRLDEDIRLALRRKAATEAEIDMLEFQARRITSRIDELRTARQTASERNKTQ